MGPDSWAALLAEFISVIDALFIIISSPVFIQYLLVRGLVVNEVESDIDGKRRLFRGVPNVGRR